MPNLSTRRPGGDSVTYVIIIFIISQPAEITLAITPREIVASTYKSRHRGNRDNILKSAARPGVGTAAEACWRAV
jgi:hypothetical protein